MEPQETSAISLWELLDANHQRVEGIGAIGASLQLVLFGLCQLFASLILLAIVDTSGVRMDRSMSSLFSSLIMARWSAFARNMRVNRAAFFLYAPSGCPDRPR